MNKSSQGTNKWIILRLGSKRNCAASRFFRFFGLRVGERMFNLVDSFVQIGVVSVTSLAPCKNPQE